MGHEEYNLFSISFWSFISNINLSGSEFHFQPFYVWIFGFKENIILHYLLTLRRPDILGATCPLRQIWRWRWSQITLKTWPRFSIVLKIVISDPKTIIIIKDRVKLIYFDLIYIDESRLHGAWMTSQVKSRVFLTEIQTLNFTEEMTIID